MAWCAKTGEACAQPPYELRLNPFGHVPEENFFFTFPLTHVIDADLEGFFTTTCGASFLFGLDVVGVTTTLSWTNLTFTVGEEKWKL